jgi:hypothetical protein
MTLVLLAAILFGWFQSSHKDDQPLVSATNPAYLSCTAWTGKEWSKPTARSARTPVMQSPKGYRAYGQVSVQVSGEDCENTTRLFVATPTAKEFKVVYTSSEGGGNGIRLLGWSPDGDQLLAEVTFWTYESDVGYGYIPLIYDSSTNSAREMQAMDKALVRFFGSGCVFEDHVRGWRSGGQLLVRVSRSLTTEADEEDFCVKKPRLFAYDIQKDTLKSVPTINKPK